MTEIHLLWAAQNGIWTPKPYFQFLNEEVPFLFPNKDFAGFWTEPQTLMVMGSQHKLHYLGGERNGSLMLAVSTASASFHLTRREHTLSQPTGCKPSLAGCCEEVRV